MRVVYHPNGATLTPYAMSLWLAATVAAIGNPPAPGVALDLGDPDYPWRFETGYLADDRETQGGKTFSRIHATRLQGTLNFSGVPSSELPGWLAWYEATQGFRQTFVLQLPDMTVLRAVAPAIQFPLELVKQERWAGSLNVVEAQ